MTGGAAEDRQPGWAADAVHGAVGGWNRVGGQIKFNARSIREIGIAVTRYRTEILRLIAQMSLGTGALALIGGTVVIVGFMTLTTGAVIAVQGFNELSGIGVEAMTGFISAYVNVRIISPAVAGIGLAATIGAGTTAQLGAMRIADEIDALEVMAVRSVAYLVSTRVVAGVSVVIPLYCVAMVCAFVAARSRHHRVLPSVHRRLRPLFQHVPQLHRPAVVVLHRGADGRRHHAGSHLLRLHRHRRAGGSRCGRGAFGTHLAGGPDAAAARGRAVHLRPGRQLPPPG